MVKNSNVEEKTNLKNDFFRNPENYPKFIAVLVVFFTIIAFNVFNLYVVPSLILTQTEEYKAEKDKKQRDIDRVENKKALERQLENEDKVLKFSENTSWQVEMKFQDYGNVMINLKNENAPKTVENFVRLTYRGYYNNTKIHRIVKEETFNVIQGGDKEKGDGTGGRSAFYVDEVENGNIIDEIWAVKPEFKIENGKNILANEAKFINQELYKDFKPDDGTVVYKKGLIIMAKTSQPNSAGSQFFITLTDTTLPADYTAFGSLSSESMGVLDKIMAEVNGKNDGQSRAGDGEPDKELKITEVNIVSPKVD
jgi:cyclophilin family peptidyl-prolyl cis-trans isomerase